MFVYCTSEPDVLEKPFPSSKVILLNSHAIERTIIGAPREYSSRRNVYLFVGWAFLLLSKDIGDDGNNCDDNDRNNKITPAFCIHVSPPVLSVAQSVNVSN
jgi:hypothetical protein